MKPATQDCLRVKCRRHRSEARNRLNHEHPLASAQYLTALMQVDWCSHLCQPWWEWSFEKGNA